jgi:hypothetical protein
MKQVKGTLLECLHRAEDIFSVQATQGWKQRSFYCQIKGPLLMDLFLAPGEAEGMTLKQLGLAISKQARVSQVSIGDQPALLEYDLTGIGETADEEPVFGKFYLAGTPEPVVLIRRLEAGKEVQGGLSSESLA